MKSSKHRYLAESRVFPYLAAKRACARLGRYTVLMIEFEGVQLSFRKITLGLVSLRSNDHAEGSREIERDLGRFGGRDAGDRRI